MTYMRKHVDEYHREMIQEEMKPLLERIEKLEAERKEPAVPLVPRPHREAP
jgi:uncharacterized protein (UPF0335 family)